MNSKKIISAIMAGACALSMTSIAAFAADATQKVEAAGEKTFNVDAGYTAPVIDVTLPTTIAAVINPYEIEIEVASGIKTGTDGISSPEYDITNNSTDFGIKVGAKLSARGTGITVVSAPANIPTKLDSEKAAYAELKTTVGTDEKTLPFTEDVPDRATLVMTLDEAGGTNPAGKFQVQGKVTSPDVVEKPYATTDKLTLTIVFDINPFNPNAGGGAGGGSSFTATVANTAIDLSADSAYTLGNLTANDTYALAIDGSAANALKPTFTGYSISSTTAPTSSDAGVVKITTGAAAVKDKMEPQANGTCTVTYTLTPDAGGTDVTVKFAVTVSGI